MWDYNYLIVHIIALIGIYYIFPKAPDAIQKLFLFVAGVAMVVYTGADIAALSGVDPVWPIRMVASRIEHSAILLYIFRQCWIKTEICQSLKSYNYRDTLKN